MGLVRMLLLIFLYGTSLVAGSGTHYATACNYRTLVMSCESGYKVDFVIPAHYYTKKNSGCPQDINNNLTMEETCCTYSPSDCEREYLPIFENVVFANVICQTENYCTLLVQMQYTRCSNTDSIQFHPDDISTYLKTDYNCTAIGNNGGSSNLLATTTTTSTATTLSTTTSTTVTTTLVTTVTTTLATTSTTDSTSTTTTTTLTTTTTTEEQTAAILDFTEANFPLPSNNLLSLVGIIIVWTVGSAVVLILFLS